MKFDFRESRIISNGNIIKSKYRPMWWPCATARRDDRAAVGWAWTGRNLILDEALAEGVANMTRCCIQINHFIA